MGALQLWVTCVAIADCPWERVTSKADTLVERRAHAEGFYEIRVSTTTEVPSARLADAYWDERNRSVSAIKHYEVLSRTENEKVSYLQLHLPIATDRDYTVRITRHARPASGFYQFSGRCVVDVGPPPNASHVRVTQCTAQLTIDPAGNGRTRVTYVAFANPAGLLPKWLVNTVAPKAAAESRGQAHRPRHARMPLPLPTEGSRLQLPLAHFSFTHTWPVWQSVSLVQIYGTEQASPTQIKPVPQSLSAVQLAGAQTSPAQTLLAQSLLVLQL